MALFIFKMTIYPIKKAQIALFVTKKIFILVKYLDYADFFLTKSAKVLSKRMCINEHAIKLQKSKQLPCRLIYNLGLVELETFKTYIKINFANSFNWPSKSLASASILFI